MEDGSKITVLLLSDRGISEGLEERYVRANNQLGAWMEKNLIRMLNRAGYDARLIKSRKQYVPGGGRYLLSVTIVHYRPGNKAARMVVGFGAGAASLDTRYELSGGKDKKPLLAEEHGVGSSRGWRKCVIKLNKLTLRAVTEKLRALH
jgi:hypothetical protein